MKQSGECQNNDRCQGNRDEIPRGFFLRRSRLDQDLRIFGQLLSVFSMGLLPVACSGQLGSVSQNQMETASIFKPGSTSVNQDAGNGSDGRPLSEGSGVDNNDPSFEEDLFVPEDSENAVPPTNVAGAYLVTPKLSSCDIQAEADSTYALCGIDFGTPIFLSSNDDGDSAESANTLVQRNTGFSLAAAPVLAVPSSEASVIVLETLANGSIKVSYAESSAEALATVKSKFRAQTVSMLMTDSSKHTQTTVADIVTTMKNSQGEVFVYSRIAADSRTAIVSELQLGFGATRSINGEITPERPVSSSPLDANDQMMHGKAVSDGFEVVDSVRLDADTSTPIAPTAFASVSAVKLERGVLFQGAMQPKAKLESLDGSRLKPLDAESISNL